MQENNFNSQPEPVTPATPEATPPAKEPKKFPVIPIVIASVVAIAIAFGATVAVLVAVNKEEVKLPETAVSTGKTESPTEEEKTETEEEEEKEKEKESSEGSSGSGSGINSLQRAQRNVQREDDLARVLTAVNNFQTNNNGKLPFSDGAVQSSFVSRYIDKKCSTSDGLTYTGCGEDFTDPDGTIYGFAKPIELTQAKKNALPNVDKLDHKFHPYTYAICGDENEVLLGVGKRDVAVLMILEGGAVFCNDNH